MPRIRTNRIKKYPPGWEKIENTIEDFNREMRDVENESSEGKRKSEALWRIY